MSADENQWRTPGFRQSVVAKIDEAVARSGMPTAKNSMEMENHVFQKAKTKEEYLGFVARLILHVREMKSKNPGNMAGPVQGQMMPDPINALQNLARQGTGNNQLIGLVPADLPGGSGGMVRQPTPQNPSTNWSMPTQLQSINSQMGGQMGNQMGPGQMTMGMNSQIHASMGHMQPRKPGDMLMSNQPGSFLGRTVQPNQFIRQSPPPSAQSPASMPMAGTQMAISPSFVPSPSGPQMTGPPRSNVSGMASSPSNSLNTPGQAVPTPSPGNMIEEQQYREKVRQLSKYIEPLRRMIARMGNDDVERLGKMKKLLEILSNPSKRMPLETLLKCEVVLEKLDLKRGEGSVGPHSGHFGPVVHNLNPLLEAVSNCLQSSVNNHTLQRTFGPTLEALFGPEIKMLPTPLDLKSSEENKSEIPEVLQGEIARLDQRFKVGLDPSQQAGSKCVRLLCWLDDKNLPCVPPISVSIPEDYPRNPPRCNMSQYDYSATDFLMAVHKALSLRIRKLPSRFSLSQLLDTWEMSVRQAAAPVRKPPSTLSVLMAV